MNTPQVFQSLERSPHARLEQSAALGEGLVAAVWRNRHDAQYYEAPTHHTLSCYLDGGVGTFRRDAPSRKGAPGLLCNLPAEHRSAWVVNGDIHLAHLYIDQERFALGCIALLDREPRQWQLEEATFLDDPEQAARFRQLCTLDWREPGERLLTSYLAEELLAHALLHHSGWRSDVRLRGGLSSGARRMLVDYIDGHLDQPLALEDLARLCNLSAYHFARMFRESFGVPPHRYVLEQRMALGRRLLREGRMPLGEVALACGFGSASHFGNRFRQAMGAAPGVYRAAFETSRSAG